MKLHLEATSNKFHSFTIRSNIIRNKARAQRILDFINIAVKSIEEGSA